MMVDSKLTQCVLIAAGKYHNIDFARAKLLNLLGEFPNVRTRVFEDYRREAISNADILITYTCDVVPSQNIQKELRRWLKAGGRWLALHGTNSILEMMEDGNWSTPNRAPLLMNMLGSRFLSHPPIAPYTVENAAPDHALVEGIGAFEVTDELYHMELYQPIEVLLEAECSEKGRGFQDGDLAIGRHPVFYRKSHTLGEVLYLTLGHCRGHHDMRPLLEYWPEIDNGPWEMEEFKLLLKRSLQWILRK